MAKVKETPEQKSARMKQYWVDKKTEKEQEKSLHPEVAKYNADVVEYREFLQNGGKPDPSKSHMMTDSEQLHSDVVAIGNTVADLPSITDLPPYTRPTNREPIKQNHMSTVAENSNIVIAPSLSEIRGKIAIKPYVSGEENMGLEKNGEVVFPGIYQVDRLGCIDKNGYKTYFTGLDENAPEVQTLPEKQRVARIKTIREVVSFLENSIANNFKVKAATCMKHFGTEDDKFWENVKTFRSSGPDEFDAKGNRKLTYWDEVKLELNNDPRVLDKTNPHDLVIYYAIVNSGLSMVAPSLSAAMNAQGAYKWYLDQPEETADIKTEQKILRNQAGAYLEAMRNGDEARLFLMSKMVAVQGSSMYKRGGPNYTPIKQMYEDQCRYIDGEAGDNPTIAVKKFLEFYNMPIDVLTRRAVIKDATEYHIIEPHGDGRLYYRSEPLGRTIEDMVEHLNNPLNEGTWTQLRDLVEVKWAE